MHVHELAGRGPGVSIRVTNAFDGLEAQTGMRLPSSLVDAEHRPEEIRDVWK